MATKKTGAEWGIDFFPEFSRKLRLSESHLLQQAVTLKTLAEARLPAAAAAEVHSIARKLFKAMDDLHAAIVELEQKAPLPVEKS